MFGNIFLGSVFKNLGPFRDNIWREVQKRRLLKCVSFQLDHIVDYPSNLLPAIRTEIHNSDFFIILIGPDYGTNISRTPTQVDEKRASWDVSFGHYEFELAEARLDSFSPSSRSERMLLIHLLSDQAEDDDLRKFRDLASTKALGWGVDQKFISVVKKHENYDAKTGEEIKWRSYLKDFLDVASTISKYEQRGKFLEEFNIDPKNHIHIAGWSGIEETKLYDKFAETNGYFNDAFSFLIMDRSLIELPTSTRYVPRLRHANLPFDFLFSDIEIVPFHIERKYISFMRLQEGTDALRSCFRQTPSFFSDFVRPYEDFYFDDSDNLQAVPLLYGFNEVIVNPDAKVNVGLPVVPSYSDFDLPTVVARHCRVGLWGWWVATFPILLLAHAAKAFAENPEAMKISEILNKDGAVLNVDLTRSDVANVETFSDWIEEASAAPLDFEKCIALIVRSIIEGVRKTQITGTITVLKTLRQLRSQLCSRQLDVVLGGTSAVLATCDERAESYECIVPKEGVYLWINCVCAAINPKANMLEKILENWLSTDIQLKMSLGTEDSPDLNSKFYIGIPARKEAELLFKMKADELPKLKKICNTYELIEKRQCEQAGGNFGVALRPFPPKAAYLLEHYWNFLVGELLEKSALKFR